MNATLKWWLAVLGLIFVTFIWGLTFILVKWTIESIDLYYFLFLRFIIGLLCMLLIFHRHLKKINFSTIKSGMVLGIFLTLVFVFQTEGLRLTTSSNAALITGLYMVVIPIISILYSRKNPGLFSVLGILLALPGLFLLTNYSFTGINKGDLLVMVVPFAAALHIIFTGEYAKRHSVVPLVIVQFIFTSIVCGVIAAFRGAFTLSIPSIGWLTLILTGVFATAFAFTVQTLVQRVIDPTRVGIIFAMEAVFGAFFGWWLGGEMMTQLAFVGACLMVSGMAISEIHPIARGLYEKIVG